MKNRTCRNIRWIWRMIYQNEPGEEQQWCVTRLSWLLKRICLYMDTIMKWYIRNRSWSTLSSAMKMTHVYIQCKCGWGGNRVHVNMVATPTAWSSLSLTKTMNTSMLWPMTRVYPGFSGCDTVGCSAKGKQHLCHNDQMVRHWWRRPGGVWGRWMDISMVTTTRHNKPISTLYSSSKQHGQVLVGTFKEPAMARHLHQWESSSF